MIESIASTKRVPEFNGPDELLDAVEALSGSEVDGCVVRNFISADLNAKVNWLSELGVKGTSLSDIFGVIVTEIPQITDIDSAIESSWDKISFDNTTLTNNFSILTFNSGGIEPHIDYIVGYHRADPKNKYTIGPLAGSLGLNGKALIGVEKLQRSLFGENNTYNESEAANVQASVKNKHPRSSIEQGPNDLVMWIHPTTFHSVDLIEKPRLAMILEQRMSMQD